ncbi:MAG: hypothetical protein WBZ29_14635 [Methanocella sp.]
MKRTYRIAGLVLVAGVLGNAMFIGSIFLGSYLNPDRGPPYDVVEGWAAAFFLIIGMLLSIFLSGVIGVLLTFNDISTIRGASVVSFLSGAITTIIPLLIGGILGIYVFSLFMLCLAVVIACDILATVGGILTFLLLSYLRKRKMMQKMPGVV